MGQSIREVMTPDPVALAADTPIVEAARQMKQRDIGDVIVLDDDKVSGVVTDRDIAVRAVAEGRDARTTKLREICSGDLVTLTPDDEVEDAIRLVRERKVRRLPIVKDGRPVGIVSLGDLAIERDADSALGDISAAPGNT